MYIFSVFERHILKLLQGLQTNFAELQKGQREIKEMLQAQAGTSAAEADPSLDVTFPIQDAKALDELELRLADPQMADRLVSKIHQLSICLGICFIFVYNVKFVHVLYQSCPDMTFTVDWALNNNYLFCISPGIIVMVWWS